MEEKRINAIILFMVFALGGTIGVQLIWYNNAVELKRSQFEQTVNDVLYQVVRKLDRAEAIEGVLMSGNKSLLYSNANQAINTLSLNEDQDYSDSTKNFTLKVRRKEALDTVGGYVKKTSTTIRKLENVNFPELNLSQEFIDSITGNIKFSADNSIDYQTRVVEDIIAQLFLNNFRKDINQRVSGLALDSLVYEELELHGINVRYKMGLFDDKGFPVLNQYCNEHNLDSVKNNTYKARIFPNDIDKSGPYYLHLNFPNEKTYLLSRLSLPITFSIVFILLIFGVFLFTIRGVFRQRNLAIIKNDFINNMTHELKTPISTISLACEALKDPTLQKSDQLKDSFLGTISEENNRLGVLVENALTTAVLDKGELRLKIEKVEVQKILDQAIKNSKLTANKKGGDIQLVEPEKPIYLNVDKVHFTSVIYNLIDNAIKYSSEVPEISVTLTETPKLVKLYIKDNGIGISKENQKKIFDKLYRVPTGNIHNVRGYGLGLSYVKAIVTKHGGKISVNSALGKGSTFILTFNK